MAGRVKRNTWDHGPSDNLKKALDKYKASKEFDNFSMPEQVVEFLSDINNYKKTFVYKDNRYAYDVKDAKISIPVSYLLMNKTFTFDARIESLNTTGYGSSLYVTYQVDDNGTVTPIKIH